MKVRQQRPSLVSMWMLDVFCCALGCVTLLWLLNTREARVQTAKAVAVGERLESTKTELKSARGRRDDLAARLRFTEEMERAAVARAALLDADLRAERGRLARATALAGDLRGELRDREARLAARRGLLTMRRAEAALAAAEADRLAKKLADAETGLRKVRADAEGKGKRIDAMAADLAALRKDRDAMRSKASGKATEIDKLRAQLRSMQGRLDDRRRTIIDLQGQKKGLADRLDELKAQEDSRFAGIAMTGRRVLFLIDMSGSMVRKDRETLTDDKWPLVTETVAKVMRSIPTLEKFQVILFAEQAAHLLGSEGRWLEYRGDASVKRVTAAMAAKQPLGATNLYTAMERAFRYRPGGLDTVYLFSDGLPTTGPGLTAAQAADTSLTATEKANLLATYTRRRLRSVWNRPRVGEPRVKVNSIGFFYESPDVGAFLWALSRENEGSFVGMSRP